MKVWKKTFELLLLVALFISCQQQPALSQAERNKTIKKDFEGKSEISVKHRYGPLTVKKSSDGKVHLEAEMLVTGKNEESMNAVLERFDIGVNDSGNRLEIDTKLDIESWNTINGKTTLKFKDGEKISGLNDVKVKMTLYVTDAQSLTLENKYDDIELTDDFNGSLTVNLYSGELVAQNLGGSLELDMKYSKARLKNVGKVGMEIYDSEFRAGDVAEMTVSSKYSEFVLGNVAGDLKIQTYDEVWQVGNVGGKLTLDDKYSEFKFATLGDAKMRFFDATFSAERAGDVFIDESKYSEYKIQVVRGLQFGNSFDDEVQVEEAGSLSAGDSKYTEYKVGKIAKQFGIGSSFDDSVKLGEVAAGFNGINLDGKYSDLEFGMAEGAQFQVSVEMKYGKFEYPESKVDVRIYKEKDSNILLQGWVGPEKTALPIPTLTVKGYDVTVVWR